MRRIGETAQLVLDVMAPGGLTRGGSGVRDAQKVRLMHAAVRHLIGRSEFWDESWGVPINQEDLGGTLMTFSLVVLDALTKLGVSTSDEERFAYLHAWNCAGHVMGLDPRLLNRDIDAAQAFRERGEERHWAPSPEGQAMTKALIETMEHATPGTLFDGFASYVVRYLGGDELGDILGVKRRTGRSCSVARCASSPATPTRPSIAIGSWRRSRRTSARSCLRASPGSPVVERAPFDIPVALADRWGVRTAGNVIS